MKLCAVVCSPREGGNTEILAQKLLASAEEMGAQTELILTAGKNLSFCDACQSCLENGRCCIDDDMQQIHSSLIAADGIILGSPVYFWSLSAQAKTVVDRTYALMHHRSLRNKPVGYLLVARRSGNSTSFNTLAAFSTIHRMRIIGTINAYGRDKGDVLHDTEAMQMVAPMAKAMVKSIQS